MTDVVIIGGGPAGAAAAITAARSGARVFLAEAGRYPRHKVCGEFISGEALATLEQLLGPTAAADLLRSAPRIRQARIHVSGATLAGNIVPPAASISRYDLDDALWRAAVAAGVDCRDQARADVVAASGQQPQVGAPLRVRLKGEHFEAAAVVNATGRWSNLSAAAPDRTAKAPRWLGLKAHFTTPERVRDVTELYSFHGGYCGVQAVATGGQQLLNVCAMVRADVATRLDHVLPRHPALAQRSRRWHQEIETVTTAPLVFRPPCTVRDQMLLAGDAAAFIDPFVGDGISIALRSGVLAGMTIARIAANELSLAEGLAEYDRQYRATFSSAFRNASRLRRMLQAPAILRVPAVAALQLFGATEFLIRKTRASSSA
jgi:flavin-dependent dehydrogenase